jgi:hypothetical protein
MRTTDERCPVGASELIVSCSSRELLCPGGSLILGCSVLTRVGAGRGANENEYGEDMGCAVIPTVCVVCVLDDSSTNEQVCWDGDHWDGRLLKWRG